MDRPYLLLDVDEVLNPLAIKRPVGFLHYELSGFEVFLSADHGAKLNTLAQWFDLVWAITWEHEAPLLGLPPDLPVMEFTRRRADETWKFHGVRDFVGDRPLAWVDAELGSDAHQWAEERKSQMRAGGALPARHR